MKALFLIVAGLGLSAGLLHAANAPIPAKIAIVFDRPENFSDVRDMDFPTDKGRDAILAAIRDHLVTEAGYFVPPGCTFTMTFSDIHLAGDFEPWRGANWDEIRIVKSIYPPAFKFSWAVTNAAGKTIRQGKEDMRVLDFDMYMTIDWQDPLRFEKAILDDWIRSHIGDLKKEVAAE